MDNRQQTPEPPPGALVRAVEALNGKRSLGDALEALTPDWSQEQRGRLLLVALTTYEHESPMRQCLTCLILGMMVGRELAEDD